MTTPKVFFIKGIALVLLLVCILFALNYMYVTQVNADRVIQRNQEQWEQHKDKATLVIMGDSHPANDLIPRYIPGSFNFAVPSETVDQTYYKFRAVVQQPQVKTIILPIDMHQFSDYRQNKYVYLWYWTNYLSYSELANLTGRSPQSIYLLSKIPVLGNGQDFTWLFSKQNISYLEQGWQRLEGDFSTHQDKMGESLYRVKTQFPNGPVPDKALYEHFVKILDLAQQKNIAVVLIKFPITPQFNEALTYYNMSKEEFYDLINQTIAPYNNVQILDYQDDFTDLTLYADRDHFNEKGAKVFSQQVAQDLKVLGVI